MGLPDIVVQANEQSPATSYIRDMSTQDLQIILVLKFKFFIWWKDKIGIELIFYFFLIVRVYKFNYSNWIWKYLIFLK